MASDPAVEGMPDPRRRSALERLHWEDVSAAAARDLPPGRVGGVIAQLRQRGRVANRRANVFLTFLLATVTLGLCYYIGLPLLRAFADGTIRTWEELADGAEADSVALDARRAAAIASLRSVLALAPAPVRGVPAEAGASRGGEGGGQRLDLPDDVAITAGDDGAIRRSTDGGSTWIEARPAPRGRELVYSRNDPVPVRPELRKVSSLERIRFSAPLPDGALIAAGDFGTILRSIDAGASWTEVRPPSETPYEGIYPPIVVAGGGLIATGEFGTVLRSDDGGKSWLEIVTLSETGEWFDAPLALADGTMIATGDLGSVQQLSGAVAARIGASAAGLRGGGAGDAGAMAIADGLAPGIRGGEAVGRFRNAIAGVVAERASVEAMLDRTSERLAAWRSGAAAPEIRRRAFVAFMESCRAGAEEPENAALTTACLQAYAASEGGAERQWWQAVAEQAPQGILLLFLLATLSGLYRYNVRLAGFHDGRADALELVVAGVDRELLTPVADALAADKVEFGAAKTPTDHAAEMATALINRAKP